MPTPNTLQEAKKQMQLARLEQKGKKGYATFYANQPQQLVRAKKNTKWRQSKQDLREANSALAIAEVTGEGLVAAQETQAIAALVVERTQPSKASASAGLSGA